MKHATDLTTRCRTSDIIIDQDVAKRGGRTGASHRRTGGSMTRKGWLLFTAMSVVWGIPYLFIKIAVRELDPSVVVFARVGIAAAVLLPVAAQRKVLRQLREPSLTQLSQYLACRSLDRFC